MNKRTNKELLPVRIIIAVAIVAIFAASLWMYFGQETVAMQSAREAYAQFMSENPESQDKDFIYIYEDSIIIAIRNGKVVRKEYTTEVDAVKAALSSKDGANYSLSGTDNGKLFAVKLFQKTDDIYALGLSTLAVGADKLSIKVVTNGMIFATFEIPAEAIDRKESPVGITVKKINPEDNVTLGKNETGFAYDIDVTNLVKDNKAMITATMVGPKGLVSDNRNGAITAYHKDQNIASSYDPKTGLISFSTTNFSPFTFTWEEIKVATLADLRYYLQQPGRANLKLAAPIAIDMTAEGIRDGAKDTYEGQTIYFGALVYGEKSLDLNGNSISYTGDLKENDTALFAVADKTSFTVRDSSSDKSGSIKMLVDHYAIWAINDSSTVNIYGGTFASDKYTGVSLDKNNKALVYSSGGEIHVRGGYFLFENSHSDMTNGGFNVLNEITTPRVWIYGGVYLSEELYRENTGHDNDTIDLIGGANVSKVDGSLTIVGDYSVAQWYTITGQALKVKDNLNEDKYIYRVGNGNAFSLSSFFALTDGTASCPSGLSVRAVNIIKTRENIDKAIADKGYGQGGYYSQIGDEIEKITLGNISGLGTTVDFADTFTGPVRLELVDSDGTLYASINLEVVNGQNVTAVSELDGSKNNVLLNDIAIASGGTFTLDSGKTLFGNGYTFDVTKGSYYKKENNPAGVITLNGATLDNVEIIGKKYTVFADTTKAEYYAAAVYATGNSQVLNSYISGCQTPLRVNGTACLVDNTTLYGGRYCNLQLKGGVLTLKNITTVQKLETIDGKDCIGLGIVVYDSVTTGTEIIVEGNITQYNWVTQEDTYKNALPEEAVSAANKAFVAPFVYTYGTTQYVNLGIISTSSDVLLDKLTIPEGIGYSKKTISYLGHDGCVATCDSNLAPDLLAAGVPSYGGWSASQQGAIKPAYTWTYPSYDNSDEGKKVGYDATTGILSIIFKENDSYVLNTANILKVLKHNTNLTVKAYLDNLNNPVQNNQITFSAPGEHTLILEYTDPHNYSPGAIAVSKTYQEKLSVNVIVNAEEVQHAKIYFNGQYAKPVKLGGKWYVMPNSSTATGATVDNTPIYAYVVDVDRQYNLADHYDFRAPILYGITIEDVSATYSTATQDTSIMDSKLVCLNTANLTRPSGTGKGYVYYNSTYGICYHTTKAPQSSVIAADSRTAQFCYTDDAGEKYYYYVKYNFPEVPKKSGCVTADTMVTLADGTKKEIQNVTDEDLLMVWNHFTGKYDVVPAAIIFNHGYDNNAVIKLNFSDGTQVKVINLHQFLDVDLNKYVSITPGNVAEYVGHRFAKRDGDGYKTVTLESYEVSEEYIEAYGIISALHYNILVEDMFSTDFMTEDYDLFNYFEIGDGLVFDAAKMEEDIAKYGLYTYEDFADHLTYEQFVGFNVQYFKIAVGKGLYTYEGILNLIDTYLKG